MSLQKLVVVGGNGFVGSAICRAALARGWHVSSISSSGKPYTTPTGHCPDWTLKVSWHAASAFNTENLSPILQEKTAVVHTLGILFEDEAYKEALKQGNIAKILQIFGKSALNSENPLKAGTAFSFESMNCDSALNVLRTYLSALPANVFSPSPFVYLSAEDIFRPWVSRRYIESKRQAEQAIERTCAEDGHRARGVYLRPSLIYHAHLRPLTSPVAALLSLSSKLHSCVADSLPTPGKVLRAVAQDRVSPLVSIANALEIPPIHVDHVAEAACVAIERQEVRGVVDVKSMRSLIGWHDLHGYPQRV